MRCQALRLVQIQQQCRGRLLAAAESAARQHLIKLVPGQVMPAVPQEEECWGNDAWSNAGSQLLNLSRLVLGKI
jgi:hypothetical protein